MSNEQKPSIAETPTAVGAPTKPINDLIADAVAAAKQQYETDKKAHHQNTLAEAEVEWQEHELQRKKKFIKTWMLDNYFPLKDVCTDAGFKDLDYFRLSLPYEGRAETLCDLGLLDQGLKVFLYRRGKKVPLRDVQKFLSQWIPTEGTKNIYGERPSQHHSPPLLASGLSQELKTLINSAVCVDVNPGEIIECFEPMMTKDHPEWW